MLSAYVFCYRGLLRHLLLIATAASIAILQNQSLAAQATSGFQGVPATTTTDPPSNIPNSDGRFGTSASTVCVANWTGTYQTCISLYVPNYTAFPGHNLGSSTTSANGWSGSTSVESPMYSFSRGITTNTDAPTHRYASGDTIGLSTNIYPFGGQTQSADEGIVGIENHINQLPFTTGTISAGASTGSNLITVNLTSNASTQGAPSRVFNDGGILLDTQTASYAATLTSNATYDSNLQGRYYTTSGATFPVSTAWGNIIPSTCVNNGNGQSVQVTTCNVQLGAAKTTTPSYPASASFVPSSGTTNLICLAGPFKECDVAVTAVSTVSPGVQSITFNTRYAWDDNPAPPTPPITSIVMQGGIEGKAIVNTAALYSWPVAYTVLGATTSGMIYIANCYVGYCSGFGNNNFGNTLVSGTAVTMYPSAEIIGTNGGTTNQAQLAGNSIPFAIGDSVVSSPVAQFGSVGMRVLLAKSSPSSCSDLAYGCGESVGIDLDSNGPVPEDATITAHNQFIASNAVKSFAFLGGTYQNGITLSTVPTDAAIRQYGGLPPGGTVHPAGIYRYYEPSLNYPYLSMNTTNGELDWTGPFSSAGPVSAQYYTYPGEESVTYVSSPVFNPNIPLSTFQFFGNVTSSTLAAPAGNGAATKCILFVHDSSTTAYTFTWPTNVIGYFTPGHSAGKHSEQCFTYSSSLASWTATSTGIADF